MSPLSHRPLGASGLMVSPVGIGCNAFSRRVDQQGVHDILTAAGDVGVTLLDTADSYGVEPGASESMLGEALRGRRDDFVIATKFGSDLRGLLGDDHGARASRGYVRRAVEGSLRRLRTDHIDLYQLHKPDGITPIEETLWTPTDSVDSVLNDMMFVAERDRSWDGHGRSTHRGIRTRPWNWSSGPGAPSRRSHAISA